MGIITKPKSEGMQKLKADSESIKSSSTTSVFASFLGIKKAFADKTLEESLKEQSTDESSELDDNENDEKKDVLDVDIDYDTDDGDAGVDKFLAKQLVGRAMERRGTRARRSSDTMGYSQKDTMDTSRSPRHSIASTCRANRRGSDSLDDNKSPGHRGISKSPRVGSRRATSGRGSSGTIPTSGDLDEKKSGQSRRTGERSSATSSSPTASSPSRRTERRSALSTITDQGERSSNASTSPTASNPSRRTERRSALSTITDPEPISKPVDDALASPHGIRARRNRSSMNISRRRSSAPALEDDNDEAAPPMVAMSDHHRGTISTSIGHQRQCRKAFRRCQSNAESTTKGNSPRSLVARSKTSNSQEFDMDVSTAHAHAHTTTSATICNKAIPRPTRRSMRRASISLDNNNDTEQQGEKMVTSSLHVQSSKPRLSSGSIRRSLRQEHGERPSLDAETLLKSVQRPISSFMPR